LEWWFIVGIVTPEIFSESAGGPEDRTCTRRRALGLLAASGAILYGCGGNTASAALRTPLTPEQFGARGDGVTDDTDAFLALSSHLNSHDGGIVVLRRGAVYRIGRQHPGGGNYLSGLPILFAENVSHFEVRMNGATLKFRDGMKFGSFHSHTGAALNTRAPHMRFADRADIGYAIMARNVRFFSVSGGRIDCNSQNAVIGGLWGDTGRQCIHYGVAAFSCEQVEWSDLQVADSCLDGLVYSYSGLTGRHPTKPFSVRNVSVSRVARNCVSVVGTNRALFENCNFERAGEAPNNGLGTLRSAPAACFDLEAEDAECRNLTIRKSNLISGPGTAAAFIADSGVSSDIAIEDTTLVGAVWTSKPRTVFIRCKVDGVFARLYGGDPRPDNNSRIIGCQVSDAFLSRAGSLTHSNLIDLEGAGPGVQIAQTTIDIGHSRLNLRGGILRGVSINFATGTNKIKNRDFAILADKARFEGVTITEQIPAAVRPADGYYITAPEAGADASILPAQSRLLWNSWSRGARGHSGRFRGP
jgi:uncharacterized protein YjbI with pentapeptide repeats